MRKGFLFSAAMILAMLLLGCNQHPGMVLIKGGSFQMGQPNPNLGGQNYSFDQQPVHSVKVSSFYIDTTLVTQADYQALMGVNPTSSYFVGNCRKPVEAESWFDAVLYCNARSKRDGKDTVYSYSSVTHDSIWCTDLKNLISDPSKNGYRLPTEAEWEYACRAGTKTDYYWGRNYPPTTMDDTLVFDSNAVWLKDFLYGPQPVASKKPNNWRLYDMAGNELEWCSDWWGFYSDSAQTNPTGAATGNSRILRGGSWVFTNAAGLCSAERNCNHPGIKGGAFGFRAVCKPNKLVF